MPVRTLYSDAATLAVGVKAYGNSSLSAYAPDGLYSDGTFCYGVVSGIITSVSNCPLPTTTSTTTTFGVRKSMAAFGITAIGGPILAQDNDDPYQTTSYADNLLVNPNLEAMSFKGISNQVAHQAGFNINDFKVSGLTILPDNTYSTGVYNVINSGKDYYNYAKKIIANSFLSSRNAVIRLHRCSLVPQAGKQINTYYLLSIDFDSDLTETNYFNITEVVGKVYTTPYQITLPVDRSIEHQTITSTTNYTFSRGLETEQIGTDWAPGNVKYGLTIVEQNVPIPATW